MDDGDRYARLVQTLQQEVETIEREVRAMEETGHAEQYPKKHAEALAKVEEINEQMAALRDAVGER